MRKYDILIGMTQGENLVIRLTIIGREESTHQWEVALRAPCPVFLPQGELSHRYCRSRQVDCHAHLSWLVASARVERTAEMRS